MAETTAVHRVADGVKFADRDDIEEFAATAKVGVIKCRERGHNWNDHDAGSFEEGGWWRIFHCPRCYTLRHEELDSRGRLIDSRYEYPDGYQLPKGTGRIDADGKGVFRLASLKRQVARGQMNLFKAAS